MDCPKCNSAMFERTVETLQGPVTIDQCKGCHGLWFDHGEAEQLKASWMSDFVDSGDKSVGKTYDRVRNVPCPRCQSPMVKVTDTKQPHLRFEACPSHGLFMDAGEFTDYKQETLFDIFKGIAARVRRTS